jgi:PadR family transcriptional regulator, regulatory protein PadR
MAMEQWAPGAPATEGVARFELAPPRRFMLPAILLLLSEEPCYGYGLVPRLLDFRFGRVDRPAVYRALAQLEQDGLVQVSAEHHHPGPARRVYSVTPLGERVLRVWMGVVREEYAHLGEVIRRYQATGTVDAALAEVEGGWAPDLDVGWSAVSTTSMWRRRLMPLDNDAEEVTCSGPREPEAAHDARPVMERFVLDPERSAVLIDARSTVGPICFATVGVEGALYAAMVDGAVSTEIPPSGWLTIDVSGLSSGNKIYDAELQRRIDSRRFPSAKVELRECAPSAPGSRYRIRGELTFHGISRPAEGTVCVEAPAGDRLVISGEQVFDIRDFAVPSPTMLMLRIFPDVRVRLHAEAARADA